MTSWLNGMEVEILMIDERPLEPLVEVEYKGTGEIRTVKIGQLRSSEGDIEIWREADEIISDEG